MWSKPTVTNPQYMSNISLCQEKYYCSYRYCQMSNGHVILLHFNSAIPFVDLLCDASLYISVHIIFYIICCIYFMSICIVWWNMPKFLRIFLQSVTVMSLLSEHWGPMLRDTGGTIMILLSSLLSIK